MATQIKSDAMVSGPEQQGAISGKRGGKRHRRGVVIIAALVLALIASVAVGRALSSEPTDANAPNQERVIQQDPDADAYAMAQAARPSDTGDQEQAERTQTNLGWTDARDYAPVAAPPATSAPTDLVHWLEQAQQAHLRDIEVRDNGTGTSGGSCLIAPEYLCP